MFTDFSVIETRYSNQSLLALEKSYIDVNRSVIHISDIYISGQTYWTYRTLMFLYTMWTYQDFSSELIGVFIIATADHGFGFLVFISTVRKTKKSLKNWQIGTVWKTSGNYDASIFKTIIWSLFNNENGNS